MSTYGYAFSRSCRPCAASSSSIPVRTAINLIRTKYTLEYTKHQDAEFKPAVATFKWELNCCWFATAGDFLFLSWMDWFCDLIFRTNRQFVRLRKHFALTEVRAQSWYKVCSYELVNPTFKISLLWKGYHVRKGYNNASCRVGYLSNERRFSVESSLQGISSNLLLWKQNNSSIVM